VGSRPHPLSGWGKNCGEGGLPFSFLQKKVTWGLTWCFWGSLEPQSCHNSPKPEEATAHLDPGLWKRWKSGSSHISEAPQSIRLLYPGLSLARTWAAMPGMMTRNTGS
jgi:hypothetical protein